MKPVPKVSVIIVNYNGMPHIDGCVSSILKQNYSNFEVIFVDNASTDGSLEYAREAFSELIFVTNDSNLGYVGGIYSGLKRASGEYIAPINMDTEVTPNWLSSMVKYMDVNPRVGAVNPKILLYDDRNTLNSKGLDVHITGLGFARGLMRKDDGSVNPEKVSGVNGCSYMIRRELLERMGGAPEDCFMYYDDVVISWLIKMMGYETYCIPEAVVFHKYGLAMNQTKFYYLETYRHSLIFTSLQTRTLLLLSPIFLVIEAMILSYALIKGWAFFRTKLRAYKTTWQNRDAIRKKKEKYASLRKLSDRSLLIGMRWNLPWEQLIRLLGYHYARD
jgi:hypothetical protein